MRVRDRSVQNSAVTEKIVSAIKSLKDYQYRSAPGLAQQTGIHLEHIEYYLIRMAQSSLATVGTDKDGILWVHLGKID